MKILGCDLHAKQQSIAMVDTETGEFTEKTLSHEGNEERESYAALVGIEPTTSSLRSLKARYCFACAGIYFAIPLFLSVGWIVVSLFILNFLDWKLCERILV